MSSIYTWNAKELLNLALSTMETARKWSWTWQKFSRLYFFRLHTVKMHIFWQNARCVEIFSHWLCCFAISSVIIATCRRHRHSGEVLIYAMLYVCTVHILTISFSLSHYSKPQSWARKHLHAERLRGEKRVSTTSHYTLNKDLKNWRPVTRFSKVNLKFK